MAEKYQIDAEMRPVAQAMEEAFNLLPDGLGSPQAVVMMWAIGLQESRMTYRAQIVQGKPGAKGPARGLWQFERGGGAKGVLEHHASRFWMKRMCARRGVEPTAYRLWLAFERDDVLAAAAARLLLFTDPRPLPAIEDKWGAWRYYIRNWRPGKPHEKTWPEMHERALELAAMQVPM